MLLPVERATGYARLGSGRIAYEVFGSSPLDLVLTAGSFGAFDTDWEDPLAELFFRRLASFARVVRFDRRGTGGSDPLPLDALPPWESFVEELDCVMTEVGSERTAIMTSYDAGPMGMLFAATRPERTAALILVNTSAKYVAADDYPEGIPAEAAEQLNLTMAERWGSDQHVLLQVPSRADDPRFRSWYAKKTRSIAGPTAAAAYFRSMFKADARAILPAIHVPTLVLHRTAYRFMPIQHGRYLAEHIDGARLVELPGSDGPLYWDHPDEALDAVEEFLTGVTPPAPSDRALATVLYTDIVDSTAQVERMGDARWHALLDLHDDVAARILRTQGGRLVKSTGDGVLATFDGPGRAIRFATGFREQLQPLELAIRAGIHTGEIEVRGNDIGGIAVHLASRIMALAGRGEILVSRTVKDLVVGSDLAFEDRGSHHLKGIEGEWQLLAVRAAA
ncbi:MAG: adenylate/guanylate cyclase domain-containing protein [Actinomycetota bacterium]|nr:adenylate/guanylate cyclase domain-containing protein [Actinomycetota bacterium]